MHNDNKAVQVRIKTITVCQWHSNIDIGQHVA